MPVSKSMQHANNTHNLVSEPAETPKELNAPILQALKEGKLSPEQQSLLLKIIQEDAALLKQLGR